MRFDSPNFLHRLLRVACLALVAAIAPHVAVGQAAPAASAGPAMSRFDIYAGYAYYRPFSSDIGNIPYATLHLTGMGNVAGYFGNHFGIQAEGNYAPNAYNDNDCVYTAQAGPIYRLPKGRFVPFVHILGGGAIVGGPRSQRCDNWGYGGTAGGGFDYILPIFHDHLAVRPIQADFLYAHVDNGPQIPSAATGGVGDITAVRASAGLVLRLGAVDRDTREAPTFNCSAEPSSPFPGDPVTLTASTFNLSPKQKPVYLWTSSGGKVAGNGPNAAVDTASLAPGTYAVTGKLVEGNKQRLVAACTTAFTVRAYEPPTVACSADKAAIHSGDGVAIRATARSPQNRPLLYSYGTTSGVIVGNGPTAALSTAGTTPGNITVTCNVSDDKGQTASATVSIVVASPPPPPPAVVNPTMQSLCSITFDRDRKRPDRVDNEAKGCLDDVALTLNREATSKLLLIGTHAAPETNRDSAIRAMNAAEYLTKEKGIDPARLDLRIGPGNSRAVAIMLVPPGATPDPAAATSFDTSSIKRTGQAYGVKRSTAAPRKATPTRKKKRKVAKASQF
jgi:hypothetical protein